MRWYEHPPGEGLAIHSNADPYGARTSYGSHVDVEAAARQLVSRPLVVDAAIAMALTATAQGQAGGSVSLVDRLLLLVVTGAVAWPAPASSPSEQAT